MQSCTSRIQERKLDREEKHGKTQCHAELLPEFVFFIVDLRPHRQPLALPSRFHGSKLEFVEWRTGRSAEGRLWFGLAALHESWPKQKLSSPIFSGFDVQSPLKIRKQTMKANSQPQVVLDSEICHFPGHITQVWGQKIRNRSCPRKLWNVGRSG